MLSDQTLSSQKPSGISVLDTKAQWYKCLSYVWLISDQPCQQATFLN